MAILIDSIHCINAFRCFNIVNTVHFAITCAFNLSLPYFTYVVYRRFGILILAGGTKPHKNNHQIKEDAHSVKMTFGLDLSSAT